MDEWDVPFKKIKNKNYTLFMSQKFFNKSPIKYFTLFSSPCFCWVLSFVHYGLSSQ